MNPRFLKNNITVYTPTFNRGYCLHRLYESLERQTTSHGMFEWLIVDDGSTDDTQQLVQSWIHQATFKITYIKQKNEGKMAKLNYIHRVLKTELCMCVDSDDYLVDNAIQKILTAWEKIRMRPDVAGIVGLDIYKTGKVVGTKFPQGMTLIRYSDFGKNKVHGDKKFIYKTSVVNSYPAYPSIQGEKFPAPGYLYRLIDVDYKLWILNEPLCVVEYLDDGLSKNKFKQFINAPNSWAFYRKERIRLADNFPEKFRNSIHYVSSCIFAKKNIFRDNKYFLLTLIAMPFGVLLNLYVRKNNNKGVV